MKKIIFIAVLLISSVFCFAQAEVVIFGGPQISSAKYTVNSKKQSTTNKYGIQFGTNLKIPFDNKLYFSPAIFYSLKGYKVKLNQPSILPDKLAIDNITTIHTFELAALLQYDFSTRPKHFFLKFGPSLDFQLSGKEKFNRSNNTRADQKMVFNFEKYGRYGANMLLQLGYENSKGFLISGQYTHGIGSINNADFGPRIWHRVFGISFGKYLGKK